MQIGTLTTWAKVAAGQAHSLAIQADGTLWAWGYNNVGQLGQNDITGRSSPVQVGSLTTWSVAVTAENRGCLAIKTDGTLWGWGYNGQGNLGDGTIANRSSPVQIGTLSSWANVSGGYSHSVARKTDGTIWAWGRNGEGQLGDGSITQRNSPVQVGTLTTWTDVTTKGSHTLGIRNN